MTSTSESHPTTTHNSDGENRGAASASYFQKTVCLHDWWLARAENDFNGKKLAVAGLTSRPEQPVRVFSSAPIIKRYDVFTLETADGICVVIKGFINKLRTTDNGFTAEVFKHFVFGFPPNWESYAANCFEGEEDLDIVDAGNVSDANKLLGISGNAMNNSTPTDMGYPFREKSPMNERDSYVEEDGPVENVAGGGLEDGDGDGTGQDEKQSATKSAVCLSDVVSTSSHVTEDEEIGKEEEESWKKAKRKIQFDSPITGRRDSDSNSNSNSIGTHRKEKTCMLSPECLSYGRSRSGRLLLPTMEFWRNQLPVYGADRRIRGIQEDLPEIQPPPRGVAGTKRKARRKKKK